MKSIRLGLLGAMLAALAPGGFAAASSVQIQVSGVRSSQGSVRIDLCTAETFLKTNCPYRGYAPAVQGTTTVTITDVPPGVYAAQVFHDLNDNHKVDRGLFGIPREDIGFTNNPSLGMHGPSFDKSSFVLGDAPLTLTLNLRHFGPDKLDEPVH
jgi:uncharacterized protein (DUF2141 family)